MNTKFSWKLIILSMLLFSSFVPSARALTAQDVFTNVITLGFLKDFGILQNPIDPIEGFTRFLLLILLFAVLFKGAELLKLGQNVAIVIAAVFSLLTVIFIPGTILLTIGASYGTIFSVALAGLPIGLGFAAYFLLKDLPWIRAILMFIVFWVVDQMENHMTSWSGGYATSFSGTATAYGGVITTVVGWIGIVKWIVLAFAIISLLQALMNLSSGATGSALDIKGMAQWGYNKATSRDRRQKTSQLNQYIEDEKELELLAGARVQKDLVLRMVNVIEGAGEIKDLSENTKFYKAVESVEKKLEDAKKEFRTVLKNSAKQKKASDAAIAQHLRNKAELKGKEKDVENIKIFEAEIMAKHKEAQDALDVALTNVAKAVKEAQKLKRITTFPANLSAAPYGGAGVLSGIVTNIKNAVIAVDVEDAVTAQKAAIQAMQGIVTETHDLLKWTD